MKKTYINPELSVIKIKATHLLAGSDTQMNISNSLVESETPGDARRNDFDWDDEEEY